VTNGEGHVDNRLGSLRAGLLVLVVCLAAGFAASRLHLFGAEPAPLSYTRPAMGTLVEITVPGARSAGAREASAQAVQAAFAEVARVDSLFSWRLPPPVQLAPAARTAERLAVLDLGLAALRESGGAFDPRVRPLVDLWGFDGDAPRIPAPTSLAAEVERLRGLGTPADAAELESRPELLHFGAWAKGYAVDRAVAVLRERRQSAALVNAGGEVRGYGRRWTVGIQHPRLPGALMARLRPGERAVATSGDYQQFFEQDGVRYHHLLDPHDGQPARRCQSVTVLAESCARADALATAVFVLGPERGLALVERLPGVECLIVDAAGERHDSPGLAAYLIED